MAQPSNLSTVTGVVEQLNNNGFKLDSGLWVNYSQYGYRGPAAGQPAPSVGQTVTAQLKNDKFLHSLSIGNMVATNPASNTAQPLAPNPGTDTTQLPKMPLATTGPMPDQNALIQTTVDTRLAIMKTIAVANPGLFVLESVDTLTELIRSLEQFVLEDLIANNTPEEEPDASDLLDEDSDI